MGRIIVTDRRGDRTDFEGTAGEYENLVTAMARGDFLAFNDYSTGDRIAYAKDAILYIRYLAEADQPVPPPVPASEVVDGDV